MTNSAQAFVESVADDRVKLIERLRVRPEGLDWCVEHTRLIDRLISAVYDSVASTYHDLPPLAVIATGGYGRSELAPFSDADLTVVPLDEAHPKIELAVRDLFRDLHVAFATVRLNVGYAYRLVNDAPGLDAKTRTGLIDSRLVAGSDEPYQALMRLFRDTFPVGQFLISKIKERESFFRKTNDTPLVVEPDLKEGAGGLRSFHCANWFRIATDERPGRPTKAYDEMMRMRNLLHVVSGKCQDHLTRQRQAEIADLVGCDVYQMLSSLAAAGLELHADYQHAFERLSESRYPISAGVIALHGEARIAGTATVSEAAAGIAIATQLKLHVSDIPAGTSPGIDGAEATFAMATGERTIRNLDRSGVLKTLLPELDACKTLMPNDTAHMFTVFEHTLRVVRNLDSLGEGNGFLSEVFGEVGDREILYLAALLHDVGKAERSLPHSEAGEKMVYDVGKRWNLARATTDETAWLVREHLTMAKFVRMRDVMQPQTALDLAEIVKTSERLNMLTVLTWADISAVSGDAWSPVQESLLRELYVRTLSALEGEHQAAPDPALYRRRLLKELRSESIPENEVQAFLESLPAHYLVSTPPDLVRLHVRYERQAREGQPTIELDHQPEIGATEVTICCLDEPGLLSKLLGVIYALDLSVHGIRASTTKTERPVALDVFTLSFGGKTIPSATGQQLSNAVRDVLSRKISFEELLRDRGKEPGRRQQSFQYTYVEGKPGILEVRAPRGRGMAYRFSRLIAQNGWNIVSARVGQWAGRGAAAFYLLGAGDNPLTQREVDEALSKV